MSTPIFTKTYRTVVPFDVIRLLELRENVLSQHLPEFDTHLVCDDDIVSHWSVSGKEWCHTKRVDAPYYTLHEDLVFI
jgi:hypothetical protein